MIKVMLNSHGLKSRSSKKRKKGRRIELMARYITASIKKKCYGIIYIIIWRDNIVL